VLVAALAGACGGGDSKPMAAAAGGGGMETPAESDSGALPERDAGVDARAVEPEPGGAGSAAGSGGAGGAAEQAGETSYANGGAGAPAPAGGQGGAGSGGTASVPTGGQPAPAEHVLWSQNWTVAIHSSSAAKGYPNATMGLALDAGDFCTFGFSGAPSGTSQDFQTDGACITQAANVASGVALIFDSNGMNSHGSGGRAPLSGWTEAVTGHTVTKLRRTQTYTIQLLGAGDTSYNYADFEGKWEAIGR